MSTLTAILTSIILLVGTVGAAWWVVPQLDKIRAVELPVASEVSDLFKPKPTGVIGEIPQATNETEGNTSNAPLIVSKDADVLREFDGRFSNRIAEHDASEVEAITALERDHQRRIDMQDVASSLESYFTESGTYPDVLTDLPEYLVKEDTFRDELTSELYQYQKREAGLIYVLCAEYETEPKTCYREDIHFEVTP